MGLAEVLTIVFVVLKLVGYITWSWWWIVSPMIITYSIFVVILGLVIYVQLDSNI